MERPGRLSQLVNSVADAGRDLMRAGAPAKSQRAQSIAALCEGLMSTRGEASGTALAREVTRSYAGLDAAGRREFFALLAQAYEVDPDRIVASAEAYSGARDFEHFLALQSAVEPPRQELFRRINMSPIGTATLVDMRRRLLELMPDDPALETVEADLNHLLGSWFNRGFLSIEQINWHTPAVVLEKLIAYEAVHRIEGWDDLRRRLADDRRCFAFFHPALPDDPVIFVQVALTNGIAASIQPLLDQATPVGDARRADCAIFYSISNCQAGLAGISFGNFLIKQVVLELAREFPNVQTYSTLSPIPGFRRWLDKAARNDVLDRATRAAYDEIQSDAWLDDPKAVRRLKKPLMRACAHYLISEKRDMFPRDAVARFHLRNGARLQRINWLGDTSQKGMRQSAGILVNYLYAPSEIERNHEAYVKNGVVAASQDARDLQG